MAPRLGFCRCLFRTCGVALIAVRRPCHGTGQLGGIRRTRFVCGGSPIPPTTGCRGRRTSFFQPGTGPGEAHRFPSSSLRTAAAATGVQTRGSGATSPPSGGSRSMNPDGMGRRFEKFSYGYTGQIDDLARMPDLVVGGAPVAADRPRSHLRPRDEHGGPGDAPPRRAPPSAVARRRCHGRRHRPRSPLQPAARRPV